MNLQTNPTKCKPLSLGSEICQSTSSLKCGVVCRVLHGVVRGVVCGVACGVVCGVCRVVPSDHAIKIQHFEKRNIMQGAPDNNTKKAKMQKLPGETFPSHKLLF